MNTTVCLENLIKDSTCYKSNTPTCIDLILPNELYLFKVSNRNFNKRCEICSKLTIKTPMTSFWCYYCWLWTYIIPFSIVSIVDFERVNISWVTDQRRLFMKSSTFESGLSDFHKFTTTILKKTISKGNSEKIFYRNYKSFGSWYSRMNQVKFEEDSL